MNRFRSVLVLSIAVIAFSFAGASAQTISGTRQTAPDAIDRQIHKQLVMLPNYGVFDHITFQNNGGVVTLSGESYSLGTKYQATNVVKSIKGVTQVINNIRELPPSPFDDSIRRQLLNEFTRAAGLNVDFTSPNPEVSIVVENGRVTLEGYVSTNYSSNVMNILANSVPGVFSVKNNLIVGKNMYR